MEYHYAHDRPNHERKLPKGRNAARPALDESLWPTAEAYLTGRGIDAALARENRIYPSRCAGDSLPRLVFSATNSTGLFYYQARAMVPAEKRYQSPPVQRGDSVIVVWPLGEIAGNAPLVVVEGPFDALAAASIGYIGVGLMGSRPPEVVLDFVAGYLPRRPIIVVADMDLPADAARVSTYLASKGRRCTLVLPTPHKDLCAAPILYREELLKRGLARLSKST